MAALLVTIAVGVALMFAPAWLPVSETVADSFRIAGPVIAAVGFIAAPKILRGLRWLNLAPGGWLLAAPLFIDHRPAAAAISLFCGAATIALAAAAGPGQGKRRYGGAWDILRPPPPPQ